MPAPARAPLTDLPEGHEFSPTTFALTEEEVRSYLDAVADTNAIYLDRGLAPPLAVAARALGALLDEIELPPGSIHRKQDLASRRGVAIGADLRLAARIASRMERGDGVFTEIAFEVTSDATDVLSGSTTVISPQVAS